jgi:hypothetical protein
LKEYTYDAIKKLEEDRSKYMFNKLNEDWSSSLKFFSVVKRAQEEFYSLFSNEKKPSKKKEIRNFSQPVDLVIFFF